MNRFINSFRAMGCQIQVWLEAEQDATKETIRIFADAEKRFSRFLPNSELCQLNQAQGHWTQVSEPMWEMVVLALQMAEETGGLFDPTILSGLERAGYTQSFVPETKPSCSTSVMTDLNFQSVELDAVRRAIRLPDGVKLDLGGLVKGVTAELAVFHLSQYGACLIDAGGDLVAGNAPTDTPLGWPVAISAPWGEEVERLWLCQQTLATSGVDYRHWLQGDVPKHHIIDPLTQDSAQTDLLTVSIVADRAHTAEAWATGALVAGKESAAYLLKERRELSAVFIDQNNQIVRSMGNAANHHPLAWPIPSLNPF